MNVRIRISVEYGVKELALGHYLKHIRIANARRGIAVNTIRLY